jgi:hypothetical protein
MGIVGTHPAVFVRVANKGLAGYGTWKSIRKMGDRDERRGLAEDAAGKHN